jgi:hypothetical protein
LRLKLLLQVERYKSPGSDEIPAEVIQAGGETLQSEIHKLINSIWNRQELPDQWKEFIIVLLYCNKTDCSNYLSTSYKILPNILLRLSLYRDNIIRDHQCGFRNNKSATDQIFCIFHILQKKCQYDESVHQLLVDFKKTYNSVRRVWGTDATS